MINKKVLVFFSFLITASAQVFSSEAVQKVTLQEVIKWNGADVGLEENVHNADQQIITETKRGIEYKFKYYDGIIKGWVNSYYSDGKLKRKKFSGDGIEIVRGKRFDYLHYENNVYAFFGSMPYPKYVLKNGRPYSGFFEKGTLTDTVYTKKNKVGGSKELHREFFVEGYLDIALSFSESWSRYYVKDGIVTGAFYKVSMSNEGIKIVEEFGMYSDGFKDGKFTTHLTTPTGYNKETGITAHSRSTGVEEYSMGVKIE
jgi:hypothetical protein